MRPNGASGENHSGNLSVTSSTATLLDNPSLLKVMLLAERAESERLRQSIRELQRHRFGRRAESLPEEQLQFALEEAEQIEGAGFAKNEGRSERKVRAAKRRANRGALPAHLPRIETVVGVASPISPGCSGTLHRIGEDVCERLNIVRSTLADWVGRAAFLLRPVHQRLLDKLKASSKLFADEITAPVLDPGRGRTKTGQLFAYARDDRSWGGSDPPGVAYVYAPDRKAVQPIAHLAGFRGILQVDGYAGYKVLAERSEVRLAFCWSHVRRHFYELAQGGPAPIASEALVRIAAFYRIEDDIRGRSSEERLAVRQERTRPLVEALQSWLREKLSLISQKTKLAEAIRYALSRWVGLCLFLEDGRVEIDNNVVERAIRPLALNRKNALFAGSDGGAEHWAVIAR
jgi:hypothetical protein